MHDGAAQSVRTSPRGRTWITYLGLAVALAAAPAYVLLIGPSLLRPILSDPAYDLVGMAVLWLLAASLWALVLLGERTTLASVGWRRPGAASVAWAVGAGLLLSLLVPVLVVLSEAVTGRADGAVMDLAGGTSPWTLAFAAVTAAVTEEFLFRGYALTRLTTLTRSRAWAAGISLAAFTLLHLPGWGPVHALGVVLPLGAALTGLYLWKRNLPLVMIAHLLVDLPLVVLAFAARP